MGYGYYRFCTGTFIEADTFLEAQVKYIEKIIKESESAEGWHKCTCLGFQHHWLCPEKGDEIPY